MGKDSTDCVWVNEAYGVAWVGAGDGGDENNQTQPDFAPEVMATAFLDQNVYPAGTIVRWELTDFVIARTNSSAPFHGIVVRDVTSDGVQFKSVWFVSREGEEQGLGAGPRVLLEF